MNIIAIRQQRRSAQINRIVESLKKAAEEGREVDKKKLTLIVMDELNVARRTAQEYIDVAYNRFGRQEDLRETKTNS